MKTLLHILPLLLLSVSTAVAQVRSVTVNTNGVLVYPTNFFTTNLVGTVSGSGASGYVPKWTGSSALGNSIMSESGQTLSLNGGASVLQTTTGDFTLRSAAGSGDIILDPATSGYVFGGTVTAAPSPTSISRGAFFGTDAHGNNSGVGLVGNNTNLNSYFTSLEFHNVGQATDRVARISAYSGTANAQAGYLVFETHDGSTFGSRWFLAEDGKLNSVGAQTIRSSTGNLTLATAGGNGNILMTPNGSGAVNLTTATTYPFRIDNAGSDAHIRLTRITSNTADWNIGVTSNELRFYDNAAGAYRWTINSSGNWVGTGAKTVTTTTGNLTLATGGGNGNIVLAANGSGATYATSGGYTPLISSRTGINGAGAAAIFSMVSDGKTASDGFALMMDAQNSSSTQVTYGRIMGTIVSPTAGAESAVMSFATRNAGSLATKWKILESGVFEAETAQTVRTLTGNLTLASAAGNGHVLLTPHGTGGVGVNTTPTSTFHVNGSEASAYAAKTTNYTLTATDQTILASAGSGSVTMTLPTSVGIGGRRYTVKRTDASANTLTVATTSSQTIDGSTSVTIPAYGILQVISDNANWAILNSGNVAGASATPTTAPNPLTRRVNHMIPQGGGTVTINGLGDTMSQSAGTQSAVSPDSNVGTMVKWATAATSGARAYGGGNANYRAGRNLLFAALVRVADTNAVRIWVAFTDGAITGLCDNDDPSGYHLAGFRWSTAAGDTAWMACTKDGTTLGTTSTGITPSTTAPMRLEVEEDTANAKYYFRINGTLVATRTANLPGTTVNMYYGMTAEPTENVSKSIEFGQATIVSDK